MTQSAIAGLTVQRAVPPSRDAALIERRAVEARAALLTSAVKRCRALAARLADDERWCVDVERRLNDPALAHIPPDDPLRVRAREDLAAARSRIDEQQHAFAHWRRKADAVWGEMSEEERRATGINADLEPWAIWCHLGELLIAEYVRVGGQ